jgi:hypothetical protein
MSLVPSAPFAHVLLRFFHSNGCQSCIITSFAHSYGASRAAYDKKDQVPFGRGAYIPKAPPFTTSRAGDDVVNFHLRYPSDPPSAMKKLPGFTVNG